MPAKESALLFWKRLMALFLPLVLGVCLAAAYLTFENWRIPAPLPAPYIDNVPESAEQVTLTAALEILRAASAGEGTRAAADELAALYESFADAPYRDRIRLDLSIVNDVDYYTGIIFQGYVARVPKMILSGGRYDGLLSRIGRTHNAMGFALNLGALNVYYPRGKEEA